MQKISIVLSVFNDQDNIVNAKESRTAFKIFVDLGYKTDIHVFKGGHKIPLKAKTAAILIIILIIINISKLKIVDIKPKYKKAIINTKNKYIESLVALILSAINPENIAHSGLKYERLLIVEAAFSLL